MHERVKFWFHEYNKQMMHIGERIIRTEGNSIRTKRV